MLVSAEETKLPPGLLNNGKPTLALKQASNHTLLQLPRLDVGKGRRLAQLPRLEKGVARRAEKSCHVAVRKPLAIVIADLLECSSRVSSS